MNTKTNTFREHIQIVIQETCDFWDIWSEWWGDMTWSTKRQLLKQQKRQSQLQIDRPWQTHDMVCKLEWFFLHFRQLRTWIQEIIVTWQSRVTLDSICNSCDVWPIPMKFLKDTGRLDRYVVEDEGCDHLEYMFNAEMYLPAVCLYLYETVNSWRWNHVSDCNSQLFKQYSDIACDVMLIPNSIFWWIFIDL